MKKDAAKGGKKAKERNRLTIRFPETPQRPTLLNKLENLADKDGRDVSNYVRKILTDHVKSQPATAGI